MRYKSLVLSVFAGAVIAASLAVAQKPTVAPVGGPAAVGTSTRRSTGLLHRSQVAVVDKIATPGTLTVTAQTEAGSTLSNVLRNVAVSAGNMYGSTLVSVGSATPTLNQAVRILWASVSGATFYDVFLGTVAQPLWVVRITEAQRVAGGIVSAVGVYGAGGAPGGIDIGIDGTGTASNGNPFLASNAYLVANATPFSMVGWSTFNIHFKLTVDDLRSQPLVSFQVFVQNQVSGEYVGLSTNSTTNSLNNNAASLLGVISGAGIPTQIAGSPNVVVLVTQLTGQNAKVDVWIERVN